MNLDPILNNKINSKQDTLLSVWFKNGVSLLAPEINLISSNDLATGTRKCWVVNNQSWLVFNHIAGQILDRTHAGLIYPSKMGCSFKPTHMNLH